MSETGRVFRVTLFGESHGPVVGALACGMPAGVEVDESFLQAQLDRRRPGQSAVTTPRSEEDRPEILSGAYEGRTTGAPIALITRNRDTRPEAYASRVARPGHADLAGHLKFFGFNDPRGGGHFGGRLTWGLTAMGALARLALRRAGVEIVAYAAEIAGIHARAADDLETIRASVESNPVRCPDAGAAARMVAAIEEARAGGDSVGGIVACRVRGLPPGLGGYHFASVESELSRFLFGIPAVKGVGVGAGFDLARMRGSESNGSLMAGVNGPVASSPRLGGVSGGLTDGEEVSFSVAFKPPSSIARPQASVDLGTGRETELKVDGRHDPCLVPRAVPVVENAVAIPLLDLLLQRLGEEGFHERGLPVRSNREGLG